MYELLAGLQAGRARGLRIHLVGHSFGGKLLSAAMTGHGRGPGHVVDSFVIVQGAFSHFAFSSAEEIRALGVTTERGGLYAGVAGTRGVTGPLVVTYSGFDTPNAVFYPMAFGLVRDMLEADEVPRYGALGANGIKGPRVRIAEPRHRAPGGQPRAGRPPARQRERVGGDPGARGLRQDAGLRSDLGRHRRGAAAAPLRERA